MMVRKTNTGHRVSGPDKGTKNKVIKAYPAQQKILMEGMTRIKRHVANPTQSVTPIPVASLPRKHRFTFPT